MAFPTIASSCPPINTTKGEGFYVELFFDTCLPLGVVAEIVIPIFIGIGTSSTTIKAIRTWLSKEYILLMFHYASLTSPFRVSDFASRAPY